MVRPCGFGGHSPDAHFQDERVGEEGLSLEREARKGFLGLEENPGPLLGRDNRLHNGSIVMVEVGIIRGGRGRRAGGGTTTSALLGPSLSPSAAPSHPTHPVRRVLLGTQASWMLIGAVGACDPMLCPNRSFQARASLALHNKSRKRRST